MINLNCNQIFYHATSQFFLQYAFIASHHVSLSNLLLRTLKKKVVCHENKQYTINKSSTCLMFGIYLLIIWYSRTYHGMLSINSHVKYITSDSYYIGFTNFGEIWNFKTHMVIFLFCSDYIYIYARPLFQWLLVELLVHIMFKKIRIIFGFSFIIIKIQRALPCYRQSLIEWRV